MRFTQFLILASTLLASVLSVHAEENATDNRSTFDVRFSGFATFALTTNDSDKLGYRSTAGQDVAVLDGDIEHRTDTRLGLQWNFSWSSSWDAAVQVVADETARVHDEDYLDWAFLRYRPQDGSDLRVGRLGLDVFMLSDYRQTGYTYPWVRPPVDFYGLIALYSMDGIDYQQRFDLDEGSLYAKAFIGRSHFHSPTRSGDFNISFEPIVGFTLLYESEPWKARLSHTDLKFSGETDTAPLTDALTAISPLWPQASVLAREVMVEDSHFTYSAIGASYDDNTWLIQAELGQVRGSRDILPNGKHGYISLARRIDDFTVYGVIGKAKPDAEPLTADLPATIPPFLLPQVEALRDATIGLLNSSRMDQNSVGIGARWDFVSRMALKLQWDRYRVKENGTGLWHPDANQPDTAHVVTLSLDMLF